MYARTLVAPRRRTATLAAVLIAVLVIAYLDARTTAEAAVWVAQLAPIAFAAVFVGRREALAVALFAAAASLAADLALAADGGTLLIAWNALMRLATYAIVSVGLANIQIARHALPVDVALDPVTETCTAEAFFAIAQREMERARHSGKQTTLLFIGLEGIRNIIATHDTEATHEELAAIGATIRGGVRGTDVVARIAPDEFAVLMPETAAPPSKAVSERLRTLIRRTLDGTGWPIEVRIGSATVVRPPDSVDAMLQAAQELIAAVQSREDEDVFQGAFGH